MSSTDCDENIYIVFDCPGQIELYSHVSVFRKLAHYLQKTGWRVGAVFILDSHFIIDIPKFIAGALQALSAMVLLETPHINVLTKMDLFPFKGDINCFLNPVGHVLTAELTENMTASYRKMNYVVSGLLDDFSMVSFLPLDITEEESLGNILLQLDIALQYKEDGEQLN